MLCLRCIKFHFCSFILLNSQIIVIIISLANKPDRAATGGVLGVLIGIFIIKLITLALVAYQYFLAGKTFVAEMLPSGPSPPLGLLFRLAVAAFLLYDNVM